MHIDIDTYIGIHGDIQSKRHKDRDTEKKGEAIPVTDLGGP
jgi:hypothetical protein